MLDDNDVFEVSIEALRKDLQTIKASYMLDDKDAFTTTADLRADMELASFRGYVQDVLTGRVWFKAVGELGKFKFAQHQINQYSADLDKALQLMVWNA